MKKIDKCAGQPKSFAGTCERSPCVVRDGVHYCWQHDPERRAKIAKQKRKNLLDKNEKEEVAFEASLLRHQLAAQAGIDSLSDDDIRAIIKAGGIQIVLAKLGKNV